MAGGGRGGGSDVSSGSKSRGNGRGGRGRGRGRGRGGKGNGGNARTDGGNGRGGQAEGGRAKGRGGGSNRGRGSRGRGRGGGRAQGKVRATKQAMTNNSQMSGASNTNDDDKRVGDGAGQRKENKRGGGKARKARYVEHLALDECERRVANNELLFGKMRSPSSFRDAFITIEGLANDLYIPSQKHRNRAFDGDWVFLEVLPETDWRSKTDKYAMTPDAKGAGGVDDDAGEGGGSHATAGLPPPDADQDVEGENWFLPIAATDPLPQPRPMVPVEGTTGGEGAGVPKWLRRLQTEKNVQGTARVVAIKRGGEGGGDAEADRKRMVVVGCLARQNDREADKVEEGDKMLVLYPLARNLPLIFVPIDRKVVPRQGFRGKIFEVMIKSWKATASYPLGIVTRCFGDTSDINVMTKAICRQYEINDGNFPAAAIACLPEVPFAISEEERGRRRDFRGERVVSIDPPTARDLDDALHVKQLPCGNIEVGVHIADVSHFVLPGSDLDKEAKRRATSYYFVDRVIPMLPRMLCDDLCSLLPDVERLAFSAIFTFSPAGDLLDEYFTRSVIKSRSKMSYAMAQAMIEEGDLWKQQQLDKARAAADTAAAAAGDGGDDNAAVDEDWDRQQEQRREEEEQEDALLGPYKGAKVSEGTDLADVAEDVRLLYTISSVLRRRRFASGALAMNNKTIAFDLTSAGLPCGVSVYETKDAHGLIEEFMLLANIRTACFVSSHFRDSAVLRRHPPPKEKAHADIRAISQRLPVALDPSSSRSLAASLGRAKAALSAVELATIYVMLTRQMQTAVYFCTGDLEDEHWRHYALNVPYYTHFTSPIRRYPDIMVHRLLDEALTAKAAARAEMELSAVDKNGDENDGAMVDDEAEGGGGDEEAREGRLDAAAAGSGGDITDEEDDEEERKERRRKAKAVNEICEHCNKCKNNQRLAREQNDKLFLAKYLEMRGPARCDGIVFDVADGSFSVHVPEFAIDWRFAVEDDFTFASKEWNQNTLELTLVGLRRKRKQGSAGDGVDGDGEVGDDVGGEVDRQVEGAGKDGLGDEMDGSEEEGDGASSRSHLGEAGEEFSDGAEHEDEVEEGESRSDNGSRGSSVVVRLLSKVKVEIFPRLDRVPVDCGISVAEFL